MNESQARMSFIDSFWDALGWDVRSSRHVQVETRVKSSKPDYRFLVDRKTVFFVEAKRPAESLQDPKHIFQAKSYAWSAGVPLVVLTDFEEFRVFLVKSKPIFERPNVGLVREFDFKWDDYEGKWGEIERVFSRENVENGSLSELTRKTNKELTQSLDKDFLETISNWREELAKNIANRNEVHTAADLSEIVQRIIDRVVFLRILEDRKIEEDSWISRINENGQDLYREFLKVCGHLRTKYNGLIFNEHKASESVNVDDAIFLKVLKSIHPEKSPYKFDVVPVEILGKVYENFLGYEIRLTKSGRAKIVDVDQKAEVKKAGGVFYTPPVISREICLKTIGPFLSNCKSFNDVLKISVADISCGSGSFVISALDVIVEWCENYFLINPEDRYEKKGKINIELAFFDETKRLRLTLYCKSKLITSCIYGIDLDAQAVEVTQMSLFLKMLETYREEGQTVLGLSQAILPKLDHNIIRGNSLVEEDYIDNDFFSYSEAERNKINPINIRAAFPIPFRNGGFDVIVGNPPYILLQDAYRDDKMLTYFKNKYSIAKYKIDTYHLFMHRAVELLKNEGYFGYITPSNFATNNNLDLLRKYLLVSTEFIGLTFVEGKVFDDASVDTAITILRKKEGVKKGKIFRAVFSNGRLDYYPIELVLDQKKTAAEKYSLLKGETTGGLDKVVSIPLAEEFTVSFGMQLRNRKIFKDDVGFKNEISVTNRHVKCYTGGDIKEWVVNYGGLYCLEDKVAQSGGCWDLDKHHFKPKVLVRQIGRYPICGIDQRGYNCLNTLFMIVPRASYSPFVLLAVLNSELMREFWVSKYFDERTTFPKIKGEYLKALPLPKNDKKNQHKFFEIEETVKEILEKLDSSASADAHIKVWVENKKKRMEDLLMQAYGL